MFPILIIQFYGNLSIAGVRTNPNVKVAYKRLFRMQQHSKEQHSKIQVQALVSYHSQHCLDLCFILECIIIIFVPFSWISQLYFGGIELKLTAWCMVNLKEQFLWRSMKGVAWSFSTYRGGIIAGINSNIGFDIHFVYRIRTIET